METFYHANEWNIRLGESNNLSDIKPWNKHIFLTKKS